MLAFLASFGLGGLNIGKAVFGWLGRFFASLNSQGWLGFFASAALAFLWFHTAGEARHWKKQSDRFEKLYRADETADARMAAQALTIKHDLEQIGENISSILKGWDDAQNSRIAGIADALRVSGPGKAACPNNPRLASASGGHQQASRPGNASVDSVPQGQGFELIGMPFASTIDFAQNHDLDRAEVLTWRSWFTQLVASRQNRQSPLPTPAPKGSN